MHLVGEVKVLIQNCLFHRVLVEVKVFIQNFLFHSLLGEVKVLIQNFLFHRFISQLLLKLASWNLASSIYINKTIFLICFLGSKTWIQNKSHLYNMFFSFITSRPFLKNGGRYCFGFRRRIRRLRGCFALYLGCY